MSTPIAVLLALLSLACQRSLQSCQPPFQSVSGFCLLVNTTAAVGWCQAARLCQATRGELVMEPAAIRAAGSSASGSLYLWIGVTDMLEERRTSRTGWRMANGSQFVVPTTDWLSNTPNNIDSSDDMLGLQDGGLCDFRSNFQMGFVCQPVATPNSGSFRRVSFLQLGDITPYYCYTEVQTVQRRLLCVRLCAARWECRAALFNRAEARCRMLDFTDASVGDAIEKSGAWEKFVKVF